MTGKRNNVTKLLPTSSHATMAGMKAGIQTMSDNSVCIPQPCSYIYALLFGLLESSHPMVYSFDSGYFQIQMLISSNSPDELSNGRVGTCSRGALDSWLLKVSPIAILVGCLMGCDGFFRFEFDASE